MEPARVVIVGAGLAGLRTAERLRRGGYDGTLVLAGAERHLPYDRPPLSKALLSATDDPAAPPVLRTAERLAELDLDLRLGIRATALDAGTRTLTLSDGATLAADHVVLATGLVARTVPAWAGLAGVHTLRTFDDCLAIRRAAGGATHATVVGAGVLGSEIAAGLRGRGLAVDLVDPLPQPLCRVVGEEVGAVVAGLHRSHGVGLHLGRAVAELTTADGHVRGVRLDDGSHWATDLVVAAVGGAPDTGWLAGSGLALDDGVAVDAHGAASHPGIWAVGDLASVADPRGTGRLRIEHWTAAGDLAATVAGNVLAALRDEDPKAHTELPYMWSDQYDTKLQCLGLPRAGDEVVLLTGSLDDGVFLAAHVADGRVRAVSGAGIPAGLMRCRTAVADGVPLAELVALAPWDRKKVTA
ncbi:FAD-dependent oxidoreductase [Nocardioides carbamazepini]|uniref:NAD(P)/FAD-dependent oxidoreductase n=1 Tax=Nocardioides carbamazepini TaxID=2854259 RepID=UPI00214A0FF4|nr:FAD-dependent oxidoreductase [Nocardioides carbamazepini]MCR1786260.1 FAD-dependent oxidoreductase [Nocardioides carbamazepini]